MLQQEGAGTKDTNQERNGVSVVICCYNSAARILPTLDHLLNQQLTPGVAVEIILVDNNSSDNCGKIAQSHWEKSGSAIPFLLVVELQQGLSPARHRGVMESRYETIIFCDDDNWLEEHFIATAHRLFQEHPDAVVLGGEVHAVYETPPPEWLKNYEGFLAVGKFDKEGDITALRPFVPGAGLVMRKRAYLGLLKKKFSFICSDRKGNKLSSGGDTELCLALVLAGGRVYYSSQLKLGHFIPSGRTTWPYICRLIAAIGASGVILDIYKRAISGVRNDRSVLWKNVRTSAKYVLNPLQIRHYKQTKATGNKHQLNFEISQETLRQSLQLLLKPGYFSRIKNQIARIRK